MPSVRSSLWPAIERSAPPVATEPSVAKGSRWRKVLVTVSRYHTGLVGASSALRRPSAPVAAVEEAQEADEDGLCDLDGASEWLEAVGAHTISLLLEAVRALEQLSLLGAKQLAADVQYVDNILAAGLGLPADPRLTELVALLTADVAALPELVASTKALPDGFAASIQAKRAR